MKKFNFLKYRIIKDINGLNINILENNVKKNYKNVILMLHGFPELSYSFRHIIKYFTEEGYYCIAPDQRGYGKTRSVKFENINSFSIINLTKDLKLLLNKLKIEKCHIIGHDFGAYVAGYFSIIYSSTIQSITLMSMPFSGPANKDSITKLYHLNKKLHQSKIKKKHYQYYFSSTKAEKNIMNCRQGLKNFFRGYFYFKSNDYKENKPYQLRGFSVDEMSRMPEYYIMKYHLGMAQTVEKYMPSKKSIIGCKWLNENDLGVYVKSFSKSGFKKPLLWYRVMTSNIEKEKIIRMNLPKSTKIPSIFIAGKSDWGTYQKPGELNRMEKKFFRNYYGTNIINGAGHWVQQEQPKKTFNKIIKFYNKKID